MNFEKELNERFNSELKMIETYPEYKEYLNAGFNAQEAINSCLIIDFKCDFDPYTPNVAEYTVEFETGYTKKSCLKYKQLIKNEIVKQSPFNEKSFIVDCGMKYYKWGHFWEWSFIIRK